jgi:hypothetical protein
MLHGRYENGTARFELMRLDAAQLTSRVSHQEDDHGQDHEIGVEQQQYARVIESPSAMEATRCLAHSPNRDEQRENLPG